METKKAPQIPYGISDFVRMRTENYYYDNFEEKCCIWLKEPRYIKS